MGVAIDRFIAVREAAGLARIAGLMLPVYLCNNLFQAVSSWLMADVSQRALKTTAAGSLLHLQSLPVGFFDRNPAGELMSRLTNDIEAINQAVSQNVTSLLASVLSLAGILMAMFVLDVLAGPGLAPGRPASCSPSPSSSPATRAGGSGSCRGTWASSTRVMEEAISGQKVVKAFRPGRVRACGLPPEQRGGLSRRRLRPTAMPSCSCP